MNDKDFFKNYIPALKKALSEDNKVVDYHILTPDWFINNKELSMEMDLFEEENYDKYIQLFERVAGYFDAKSHGFQYVLKDGYSIEQCKLDILDILDKYSVMYQIYE